MTTSSTSNLWKNRREARKRWSLNAVKAKERKRIERATALIPDEHVGHVYIPKRTRPDLKVLLERKDGMKIQFSLHHFYGKLIGQYVQMSPKQIGRYISTVGDGLDFLLFNPN